MPHLPVLKTYKLFVNGGFPRTESGRSMPIEDARGRLVAHLCRASRKDLRDAVEAAHAALRKWSQATAYNRGQILYRMAEMLEGRADEFVDAIRCTGARPTGRSRLAPRAEVEAAVERLVSFAGWADKHQQVLGCRNPVAGPYHVFSLPEPTGVVAVIAPDDPPLLALVSLVAAPLCAGNTVVALASERNPVPAAVLGEVMATSDLPAGAVNILTGLRAELLEHVAGHREIRAVSAAGVDKAQQRTLELGAAENLKRVHVRGAQPSDSWLDERETAPETIAPFVETKTIWHPSAG
ncbi:MAG: aldehyde dehydrogenase family protein [Phycisphaerales bacterium]|nr:aldehyde dehydrogenase family protein [Phycisphaerales bacterium]